MALTKNGGWFSAFFEVAAPSARAAPNLDVPYHGMFVTDIVHCDSDISIGCDTPLTIFQKILRVLSSVRHFFSVARHTIIVCKLSLKEGEDKCLRGSPPPAPPLPSPIHHPIIIL
mgnify:CR=1 FL=1